MQQLPKNTLLQGGKYKIEKVLGQGGFGITYLATQDMLERKVCIKEFFFKEYCERDEATSHISLGTQSNQEIVERFIVKFIKEARTISQHEHPNIIRIHDIFKENNTAYYVMEYIEGESLNDMVNSKGVLPESEAIDYIKQVASALGFIHQRSINHLDVKPANIMVRRSDNKAILIDFGLSKQYDEQGSQTSTTPVGISHGYAPIEQYKQGGVSTFSPQTDIYSLGATFYKLVTGNTPPQAMDILDEGLPDMPSNISQNVQKAISNAMEALRKKRPQSIDDFLKLLGVNTFESAVSFEKEKVANHSEKTTPILSEKKVGKVIKDIVDTSDLEETILVNPLDEKCGEVNALLSNEDFKKIDSIEAVDLGVSVKWANMNWNSQAVKWCTNESNFSVLDNISATDFDPVYISSDKQYRIPTLQEWLELRQKCKWEWIDHNLISGYVVTGSNGNKIFLPALGKVIGRNQIGDKLKGYYWTSNKRAGRKDVYYIYFNNEQVDYECEPLDNVLRWIRAVEVNN